MVLKLRDFQILCLYQELDKRVYHRYELSMLMGILVNWATKRQKIIIHSSATCEMLALNYSVLEAFDLRNIIQDIGLKVRKKQPY